ncbi:MAG: NAD(P)/FAD-dependent oxidoreductase [Candidatus Omnitrophica bacterium]|nr:NAD(P)/FAD-dependent oxidoreductase [Candidatus Omnitrophota bacterium]
MKGMYDLAIIGGGAGGIACAKRAVKAGLKTILFEKDRDNFGGTCLNRGCIPTKFFLNSAKLHKAWEDVYQGKNDVVDGIKMPLISFLENKGLDIVWGDVYLVDKNTLSIDGNTFHAKTVVVATGSSPREVFRHDKLVCAEDLFSLQTLPDKFLIVGGGYIGIEVASLLNGLGKEVVVVEKEDRILPAFDQRVSNRLRIILETKGISVNTGKTISDYNLDEFDLIVLAVGREPNIKTLGLDKVGVNLNNNGWIKTNKQMRTNIDNIYACGDVTGKVLLAYAAEYQAEICIKNITRGIIGNFSEEDYFALPLCVFSLPQLARVGITEAQAKKSNLKHRVIRSNFLKFSSAYVYNDNDGFIQVIVDEEDTIIGAVIISNLAAELINIFSLCVKNKLTLENLKGCVFVHPTLSEIIPLILKES